MNAITFEMITELGRALEEIDRDPDARAIIVTGAGRGFCSGLDLKDAAAGRGIGGAGTLSAGGGASHLSTRESPTVTLHRIDVPVICALNGAAAGYGLDLALGCDIRLMSDRAKLVPGFAKRGIVPESGGTWFLPRLVGWAKACEIGFLAEDIGPERALELGLVNRVVPAAELAEQAAAVARALAEGPTVAYAALKESMAYGAGHTLAETLEKEDELQTRAGASQDHTIAVEAFLAKEKPVYLGK
jgi:2-(1,2-epoxy-1,2-dihydrophenyl)acetyl-CoA isomerase